MDEIQLRGEMIQLCLTPTAYQLQKGFESAISLKQSRQVSMLHTEFKDYP